MDSEEEHEPVSYSNLWRRDFNIPILDLNKLSSNVGFQSRIWIFHLKTMLKILITNQNWRGRGGSTLGGGEGGWCRVDPGAGLPLFPRSPPLSGWDEMPDPRKGRSQSGWIRSVGGRIQCNTKKHGAQDLRCCFLWGQFSNTFRVLPEQRRVIFESLESLKFIIFRRSSLSGFFY